MYDKWRKFGRGFRDAAVVAAFLMFCGWALASMIANSVTFWSNDGPFDKWRPLPWTISGLFRRILPAPIYVILSIVGRVVFWVWAVNCIIDRIKEDRKHSRGK